LAEQVRPSDEKNNRPRDDHWADEKAWCRGMIIDPVFIPARAWPLEASRPVMAPRTATCGPLKVALLGARGHRGERPVLGAGLGHLRREHGAPLGLNRRSEHLATPIQHLRCSLFHPYRRCCCARTDRFCQCARRVRGAWVFTQQRKLLMPFEAQQIIDANAQQSTDPGLKR